MIVPVPIENWFLNFDERAYQKYIGIWMDWRVFGKFMTGPNVKAGPNLKMLLIRPWLVWVSFQDLLMSDFKFK